MLRFAALALPVVAHGLTVTIPLTAPSEAPIISPSLISFSIEQDRWTDWVGATSRNKFFFNALDNLASLSGEVPHIRIGANSADHTNFNPGLQSAEAQAEFASPTTIVPYPEASVIVIGDAYYETARFLPPNTHVTWGVNFGQYNLTAAFLEAQSIVKAFSSSPIKDAGIMLDLLEIGNEADYYSYFGLRPSDFNISTYVDEWTVFAANVSAAAGISNMSSTKIQGGSFAESSHTTTGFSPLGLFSNGILNSTAGSLITVISEHHYSTYDFTGDTLLQDLMTKSAIRSNLTSFSPDIAATRAHRLDYVLGETNSIPNHGAAGVSNTAGATLWALDYALFSPQVGISRVFFHEGIGYKYNFIQPVTLTRSIIDGSTLSTPLPPHVQPLYYAAIVAAEAIGRGGITKATEISIDDPRIAGYAFFDNGNLSRAVFINSQAFLSGSTNRSIVHLDLSFSGTAPKQMSIKRLVIGYADDTSGLTWGGQTYETADARVSGELSVEHVAVSAGVDIQETEVLLLTFY